MRAVISRVTQASVSVDGEIQGEIQNGLLVYLGVIEGDDEKDAQWMSDKLCAIRLFNDSDGKLNLSVKDVGGGILLIPNFTLAGKTQKGTRPSFSAAAAPELANHLYARVAERCGQHVKTQCGIFGAHMVIDNVADGPVTVIVDSPSSL